MSRSVSNDEFESAAKDPNNRGIIRFVCNQYKFLSQDILITCGLNGLWKCLENHDPKAGNKFTTSLYRFVKWQCVDQARIHNNNRYVELREDIIDESPAVLDCMIVHEYMEKLPYLHRKVIYGKFFEGKNGQEIAKDLGCTRENVRQLLNRAISSLREMHLD